MGIDVAIGFIFLIQFFQQAKQQDMLHDICKVTGVKMMSIIHGETALPSADELTW
jgi:hypothetical protein